MAGKIAGYRKPTGAELRAQRIAREVGLTPSEEARQREERMLASLGTARDDFEWIAANRGWLLLGHSTCMEWWRDRIQPAADGLMLRPAPDVAKRVIGLIQQEQAELPPAQRSSKKELAEVVGASDWVSRGRRQDPRQRRPAARADLGPSPVIDLQPSSVVDDPQPADIAAALTQAITETAAHTSAAGPAATTGGAFPPAGETGPEPVVTGLGSGPQNSPAAESASSPHAGVPAVGDQIEERDEEEAAEASADLPAAGWTEEDRETAAESLAKLEAGTWKPAGSLRHLLVDCGGPDGTSSLMRAGTSRTLTDEVGHATCVPCLRAVIDSPAAATTSLPDGDGDPMPEQSQQPGQDSPTGVEGPRSETDSPTGLEAAQPRDDRSETSHQQVAGVSPAGEAPEESRPSEAPVELEDGDGSPASSSSSDPDVAGNPAERLLFAVAGLVHYLDQVDVDAVGPLLLGPDVEQLFDHAEEISAHITRIGKARFAEMLHTP